MFRLQWLWIVPQSNHRGVEWPGVRVLDFECSDSNGSGLCPRAIIGEWSGRVLECWALNVQTPMALDYAPEQS